MKAIFVFAHPDDESFSSGGTIPKIVKEGAVVKLITATRGEKGQTGQLHLSKGQRLGLVREKELKNAAKILGISQIYFLDYIDGTLNKFPKNEIGYKILDIFKKEKPDIVVTFNKEGGSKHPDHIQVNKSTTFAFNQYLKAASKHIRLYYTATPRSFVEKLKKQGLVYNVFGEIKGIPMSQITTAIDISKTIQIKIKALRCHQTQRKDWERFLKRMEYAEAQTEFFRLVYENSLV